MNQEGGARERILGKVRTAVQNRATTEHPGPFDGSRPESEGTSHTSPIGRFEALFTAAGGEVAHVPDLGAAGQWLRDFAVDFTAVALGRGVPDVLIPPLPKAAPEEAPLAISAARAAVAETGSLVMDARDGRRSQLLSPTHVIVLHASQAHASAREALACMVDDLPSALGFHSGPSKSADIGMVMVKGVHGPGRVIALVVEGERES